MIFTLQGWEIWLPKTRTSMYSWRCNWLPMLQHCQIWGWVCGTLWPSPLCAMEQTLSVAWNQRTVTSGADTAKAMCHLQDTLKCYKKNKLLLRNRVLKSQKRVLPILLKVTVLTWFHHQHLISPIVKKTVSSWIKPQTLSNANWKTTQDC